MMLGSHASLTTPLAAMAVEQPRRTLRLRLKPKAPTSGYVDGAWWPYSRSLSTESPEPLAVLATRLGQIERSTLDTGSAMQTTSSTTVMTDVDTHVEEDTRCAACPHQLAAHDEVGSRYCAATINHGHKRGCVCLNQTDKTGSR